MSKGSFVAAFDELPGSLPIFPLSGAVLMPHAELPLNIFEPRYINMVDDALGGHRMIGMIQPRYIEACATSTKPQNEKTLNEQLYRVGCAGRITEFSETDVAVVPS